MKNGNNSGGKRALESSLFPVGADNLSNIKKCVARRHGKMDQLIVCHQRDHSSTKGARIQHQRDRFDFPPAQTLCLLVPS